MGDYLFFKSKIFFLGILLVQDAIFAVFEPSAAEYIMGIDAIIRVHRIARIGAKMGKHDVITAACKYLVPQLNVYRKRRIIYIHRFSAGKNEFRIFSNLHVERVQDVIREINVISRNVLVVGAEEMSLGYPFPQFFLLAKNQ
jgi:hypothetical protein